MKPTFVHVIAAVAVGLAAWNVSVLAGLEAGNALMAQRIEALSRHVDQLPRAESRTIVAAQPAATIDAGAIEAISARVAARLAPPGVSREPVREAVREISEDAQPNSGEAERLIAGAIEKGGTWRTQDSAALHEMMRKIPDPKTLDAIARSFGIAYAEGRIRPEVPGMPLP